MRIPWDDWEFVNTEVSEVAKKFVETYLDNKYL